MSEPRDFWSPEGIFVHYGIGYIVEKKTLKTRSIGDYKNWVAKNGAENNTTQGKPPVATPKP